MKKLVIASNNMGKLGEIQALLTPLNIEVLPQSAFNVVEAVEPYCTFIENALTKARHASLATGLPALADDSGLCCEALQGAPGVNSAYFGGELPEKTSPDANNNVGLLNDANHNVSLLKDAQNNVRLLRDAQNNAHLLKVLKQVDNRFAYYYCCMVLVRQHDDPQPLIAEGIWKGSILRKARGNHGFGYDSLFLDAITGKSAAELTPEIKNKVSHRGHALRKMLLLIQHATY